MKIKLGLGESNMNMIAEYSKGRFYGRADRCESFSFVCTDSREADSETMFVATRGERVDGHDYISSAIERGCRCILCERIPDSVDKGAADFVVVDNSIDAFADVARGYRSERELPSVAITGSYGKTTTKNLTASILGVRFNNYCTQGNFNSVIGMPMSLMEAGAESERAVFEMGMSALGEIRSMTLCARPRVAVVANVGTSHLEYLKTRENIAKAKLEIAEGLCEGGYLLLNGDEPLLRFSDSDMAARSYKILYVGIGCSEKYQAYADNIRVDESGTEFDLNYDGKKLCDLRINLVGRHFALNASFAAVSSMLLGADEADVRRGLALYRPDGIRSRIERRGEVTLISDCYNAAPESMRGAIETLRDISVSGKRIAVLGDMRELGDHSDDLHFELGRYISDKVDLLFTLGESGYLISKGATSAGMKEECVSSQTDIEDVSPIVEKIRSCLDRGDAILFKASRSLKLERLISAIFNE